MSQKPLQIPFLICPKIDSEMYFTSFFLYRVLVSQTLLGFAIRCQYLNPFQRFLSRDIWFENYRFSCFKQLKLPKRKGPINNIQNIVRLARSISLFVASQFPTRQRCSKDIIRLSSIHHPSNIHRSCTRTKFRPMNRRPHFSFHERECPKYCPRLI